jgi:hypothetical protein
MMLFSSFCRQPGSKQLIALGSIIIFLELFISNLALLCHSESLHIVFFSIYLFIICFL